VHSKKMMTCLEYYIDLLLNEFILVSFGCVNIENRFALMDL
jgi:hypothetical protein